MAYVPKGSFHLFMSTIVFYKSHMHHSMCVAQVLYQSNQHGNEVLYTCLNVTCAHWIVAVSSYTQQLLLRYIHAQLNCIPCADRRKISRNRILSCSWEKYLSFLINSYALRHKYRYRKLFVNEMYICACLHYLNTSINCTLKMLIAILHYEVPLWG